MKKVAVVITEILQRVVEIEIEDNQSRQDAVMLIEEKYNNCEYILDSSDFKEYIIL